MKDNIQKIKVIIFDLSEVIINGYYGVEKIIEREKGIPINIFNKIKSQNNNLFCDWMRGKINEEFYFRELLKNTNWDITIDEMKNFTRENLNNKIKGTMDIIIILQDKYQLVLLSDHTKEWRDYILKTNSDLEVFNTKYFSCDIGKIKSDEGTFNFIIEKLNTRPQEVLFIDDSINNIKHAQKEGINCILFKSANDLAQTLKEMKILE